MSKQLVDGLNLDISNESYHNDTNYLSSSVLKTILKSLDDYRVQYIEGHKKQFSNKDALNTGTLLHTAILEPHLYDNSFLVYPGMRRAGREYEEFVANIKPQDAGKPIMLLSHMHQIKNLLAAYNRHSVAKDLMKKVMCEQTICGELFGVPIKTRFDAIDVEAGLVLDIKSTGYSGERDAFVETVKGLNYALSGALYCAMAEQYYGKPFTFMYIVLSKMDLTCNVYKTSEATALRGLMDVKKACAKYLKAKESGIWTEPENAANMSISNEEILEV
jgi:PDDEXK-like domain of unknown function (DUF3799)